MWLSRGQRSGENEFSERSELLDRLHARLNRERAREVLAAFEEKRVWVLSAWA